MHKHDITKLAQFAHEVNASYCRFIGDFTQDPWAFAPRWQKDSAIAGVQFLLDNPEATPADTHESWLSVKEADGWVYGEEKDADKKTHPCMVPYDQLSAEQRAKDLIYLTVVRTGIDLMNSYA